MILLCFAHCSFAIWMILFMWFSTTVPKCNFTSSRVRKHLHAKKGDKLYKDFYFFKRYFVWPGEVIKGILCFAYRRCRILVLCSDPSAAAALPSLLPRSFVARCDLGKVADNSNQIGSPSANLQILPYFFYRSVLLSSNCLILQLPGKRSEQSII